MAKSKLEVNVGIDVSKHTLDVHIHEDNLAYQFDNDPSSIKKLIRTLKQYSIRLVVFESTGVYHEALAKGLHKAEIPLKIANARHVKDFARAKKYIAKTDRIDAKVIAEFCATMCDEHDDKPDENVEQLRALNKRREQLVEMRKNEKLRIESTRNKQVIKGITKVIDFLNEQILAVEKEIKECIGSSETLKSSYALLLSIPGIGYTTAAVLLASLPELGRMARTQVAALVGVAPYNRDSGKAFRKRHIQGGRFNLRRCLYMATLTAIRTNLPIRDFYLRLLGSGKPAKLAITAAMRKLVVIINAVLRDGEFKSSTLLKNVITA